MRKADQPSILGVLTNVLFNSRAFILFFLPIVVTVFCLLTRARWGRAAVLWLTLSSLAFYGWWNIWYLPLLLGSMAINYAFGCWLARHPSTPALVIGITLNLLLLGYYKYSGFLVHAANQLSGAEWTIPHIILPLAISFFTFQQIAYLSDAHDGATEEHDFLNYCLFVTFFPHLIAGPITHHREMLPQFGRLVSGHGEAGRFSVGITLFLIGLFKKVVIADPCGGYARPVFALAAQNHVPQLGEAWAGILAYTLQIYFDFSGYTDMAIGLGLLFGISLPPNFDSPLKARNIIEFWSRWHMTLTRFLTAYVYNPIVLRITRARLRAGHPIPRRGRMSAQAFVALVAIPSISTMFVSGLWHGAGWQFIVFGLLHGFYLTVNHGWRTLKVTRAWALDGNRPIARGASVLLTFVCVMIGLVFFRADSVGAAVSLLHGMFWGPLVVHPSALHLPLVGPFLAHLGLPVGEGTMLQAREVVWIFILLAAVWTLPNATQWLRNYQTALDVRPSLSWLQRRLDIATWRPSPVFGFVIGIVGMLTLMRALSTAPTEFLYFQF